MRRNRAAPEFPTRRSRHRQRHDRCHLIGDSTFGDLQVLTGLQVESELRRVRTDRRDLRIHCLDHTPCSFSFGRDLGIRRRARVARRAEPTECRDRIRRRGNRCAPLSPSSFFEQSVDVGEKPRKCDRGKCDVAVKRLQPTRAHQGQTRAETARRRGSYPDTITRSPPTGRVHLARA